MATYTIIGGDGKEYGSVLPEDLRKWIADGRLNAQSLAKAESDAEFRPLATFPEFADMFGNVPPPTIPPVQPADVTACSRETALRKVKTPAVGLMVMAILDMVLLVYGLVKAIFYPPSVQQLMQQMQPLIKFLGVNASQVEETLQQWNHVARPIGIVGAVFQLGLSALILTGAIKMYSLRSYEFAITVAIISLVPCLTPCSGYVIGLIFGIWALVVLRQPGIKSHFH